MGQVSAGNELYVRGQEAIQILVDAKKQCNTHAKTVNLSVSQEISENIIENINFERIDHLKVLASIWNQATQDLPEIIRGLILQLNSQKLSQPELYAGNTLYFYF